MTIIKELYSTIDNGTEINMFTLTNQKGMVAKILNYGGIITSLRVPDKNGIIEDVVLGYSNIDGYLKNDPYFGAIIGRHANRIRNSTFNINGVDYNISKNEGGNHLHGGFKGLHKVVWQPEIIINEEKEALQLSYISKDGEEGYPGNLNIKVTYTLTEDNALQIDYYAVSDKDTVVNLTNHSYFNLSGHSSGNILEHKVMIDANEFTINDEKSLPTGEIEEVKFTPMDFRELTIIKDVINSEYYQIIFGNGYDHNWILNNKLEGKSRKIAEVFEEESGRVLEVYTTKPGIQFYSGNYLNETKNCKDDAKYSKNYGLCLETQHFPNALEHKHFPSPILRAGEIYEHTTIYKFDVR